MRRFFFQNNIESQTISLVSMFSKQFSKLTSRVQGVRFCCAKSSVMNLSSMELKSSRLDFLEIPTGTSSNQRPRLSKTSSNPKTQRKLWHGASLPPLPPLGASWFVVSSCFLFGLLLHVSSGLFFFFVWSGFLGFFLPGLGFF